MNKIHNNLNIENLDVSKYAKTEFDSEQMEEIRLGLENNIDVL